MDGHRQASRSGPLRADFVAEVVDQESAVSALEF
jgi:hypothetical protein